MVWVSTVLGALLVVIAVRDIFHTLWHPGGFGTLSQLVFAATWRAMRLRHRGAAPSAMAGPLALVLILVVWTLFTAVGFALIYLPRIAHDFNFSAALEPSASADVIQALYVSVVALTTLGLGDILPATPALRLVLPFEALLGFLLLTAGISWILQLYPALNRRRSLARRLTSMQRQGVERVVETGHTSVAVSLLEGVRNELAGVEMDLLQYAESYYFRESRSDLSLAAALPYVADLVTAGRRSAADEVRVVAATLGDGLEEILAVLRAERLSHEHGTEQTLAAFAEDHGHQPLRADS